MHRCIVSVQTSSFYQSCVRRKHDNISCEVAVIYQQITRSVDNSSVNVMHGTSICSYLVVCEVGIDEGIRGILLVDENCCASNFYKATEAQEENK